jgi:hypothetical protein
LRRLPDWGCFCEMSLNDWVKIAADLSGWNPSSWDSYPVNWGDLPAHMVLADTS